jgi:hypothetical protein
MMKPMAARAASLTRKEGRTVKTREESRMHEDRFRCPQCDRMVTVTTRFRREPGTPDALVQFDCTMHGMCGSPIWDPCPMYLAYVQQAGRGAAHPATPPEGTPAGG